MREGGREGGETSTGGAGTGAQRPCMGLDFPVRTRAVGALGFDQGLNTARAARHVRRAHRDPLRLRLLVLQLDLQYGVREVDDVIAVHGLGHVPRGHGEQSTRDFGVRPLPVLDMHFMSIALCVTGSSLPCAWMPHLHQPPCLLGAAASRTRLMCESMLMRTALVELSWKAVRRYTVRTWGSWGKREVR